MKKQVFIIAVAAILCIATSVASSGLPKARDNGDPDEFQSGQVLDEGIIFRGHEVLAETGGQPTPPASGECRPKPANRREVRGLLNPYLSIDISGRTVHLER